MTLAYGVVLMLKLESDQVRRYLIEDVSDEDMELENGWLTPFIRDEVLTEMAQRHFELVREHIDSQATRVADRWGDKIVQVRGHKVKAFSIEGAGAEDDEPVYGVPLVSRYSPVWLDWREAHGGSHAPIVLDDEALRMVEIARDGLVSLIPELSTAPLVAVLNHY